MFNNWRGQAVTGRVTEVCKFLYTRGNGFLTQGYCVTIESGDGITYKGRRVIPFIKPVPIIGAVFGDGVVPEVEDEVNVRLGRKRSDGYHPVKEIEIL